MLVLRFKYKGERGWKVPPNIPIGGREIPLGLASVFMVLFATAIVNLFTKSVATVAGVSFAGAFFLIFTVSERVNRKKHALAAKADEGTLPVAAERHGGASRSLGIRPGQRAGHSSRLQHVDPTEMGAGENRYQGAGHCGDVGPRQPVRLCRL